MGKTVMGNFNMSSHYIISRPQRVTELDMDDDGLFFQELDYKVQEKSRRLQARRWRKLKHQLA